MRADSSTAGRPLVISRNNSIILALLILLGIFAGSIGMIVTNDSSQVSKELAIESLANSPINSTVSLRDFHRSESVNGVKKWDIVAEKGDYFPEEAFAKLIEPVISLHVEPGKKADFGSRKVDTKSVGKQKQARIITMDAPIGNVTFSGRSLAIAEAEGGVIIKHPEGTVLTTSRAKYDDTTKNIVAPEEAKVVDEGFSTIGGSMVVNTENSVVTFDKGVKSVFGQIRTNKKG